MIRSGRGTGSLLDEILDTVVAVVVVETGCAHVVSSSGYSIHTLQGLQALGKLVITKEEVLWYGSC